MIEGGHRKSSPIFPAGTASTLRLSSPFVGEIAWLSGPGAGIASIAASDKKMLQGIRAADGKAVLSLVDAVDEGCAFLFGFALAGEGVSSLGGGQALGKFRLRSTYPPDRCAFSPAFAVEGLGRLEDRQEAGASPLDDHEAGQILQMQTGPPRDLADRIELEHKIALAPLLAPACLLLIRVVIGLELAGGPGSGERTARPARSRPEAASRWPQGSLGDSASTGLRASASPITEQGNCGGKSASVHEQNAVRRLPHLPHLPLFRNTTWRITPCPRSGSPKSTGNSRLGSATSGTPFRFSGLAARLPRGRH